MDIRAVCRMCLAAVAAAAEVITERRVVGAVIPLAERVTAVAVVVGVAAIPQAAGAAVDTLRQVAAAIVTNTNTSKDWFNLADLSWQGQRK